MVVKKNTTYKHKSQEQKYQKAFLKNGPLPKYKYPNLSDMLAIASKTLNKNDRVEIQPKKKQSPQKLAAITGKDKIKEKKSIKK